MTVTLQHAAGGIHRRNCAEAVVRDRLASVDDVYVLRSSWRSNGRGPEPFVAVIARNDDARSTAREALADVAGLESEEWSRSWTALSLGDWMIWVYPERSGLFRRATHQAPAPI
jgi:hypothetical protein